MKKSYFTFILPNALLALAFGFWYRYEYVQMWIVVVISLIVFFAELGKDLKDGKRN